MDFQYWNEKMIRATTATAILTNGNNITSTNYNTSTLRQQHNNNNPHNYNRNNNYMRVALSNNPQIRATTRNLNEYDSPDEFYEEESAVASLDDDLEDSGLIMQDNDNIEELLHNSLIQHNSPQQPIKITKIAARMTSSSRHVSTTGTYRIRDRYSPPPICSPTTTIPSAMMVTASSSSASSIVSGITRHSPPLSMQNLNGTNVSHHNEATCAVCGDGHAKLHYGVLACYGCKGFFRRTLTGKYRYVCRFGNNCIVDKYQRNSCRYCRFNRCLEVGMDPKAVRPDRDLTGKQKVPRARKRQMDEEIINHMLRLQGDDWSRKIPVETKVLLMQLLNIESKVAKGDTAVGEHMAPALKIMPSEKLANSTDSKNVSLRELFEQKPSLSGKRTEMCYEPYRMAKSEELSKIAHRSAIAAVDWVESLAEISDFLETEDKIALVKACYAPLTIFNFSARTAQNTRNPDILCLCSYSFVPRKLPPEFNGSNHLSNNLIDRTLNELVAPLRRLNLREEEVVPLKSIIILNPNAKGLSTEGQQTVADLRDKIQEMLFQIVKELHPNYSASSRFGNLLLLLPTITTLSGVMCENMQFCQVFGSRTSNEPLLNELFADFNNIDEPLITSTNNGSSPPLFENPADISLQSLLPNNYTKAMPNTNWAEKIDCCTQTEAYNNGCCSDDCCSPLTNQTSLINDFSPQQNTLNQMVLSPFDAGFESSLLEDCYSELAADSSTLFDTHDLFNLIS